jgi:hypothetical protein
MKLYSTQTLAEYCGVNDSRIRQRLSDGEIEGEKLGHRWVFTQEQADYAKATMRSRGRPRMIASDRQVKRSELVRATHDWIPGSTDAEGTPYTAPCVLLNYTNGGRARVQLWRVDGGTETRYVDADKLRPRE